MFYYFDNFKVQMFFIVSRRNLTVLYESTGKVHKILLAIYIGEINDQSNLVNSKFKTKFLEKVDQLCHQN